MDREEVRLNEEVRCEREKKDPNFKIWNPERTMDRSKVTSDDEKSRTM